MSREIIMTAAEIRMELAKRKMPKKQLARAIKINYEYLIQILNDQRKAEGKRRVISRYLRKNSMIPRQARDDEGRGENEVKEQVA